MRTRESARTRSARRALIRSTTVISGWLGSDGSSTSSTEPTTTPLSHTAAPGISPPTCSKRVSYVTWLWNSPCFFPSITMIRPSTISKAVVNRPTFSFRRRSASAIHSSSPYERPHGPLLARSLGKRPGERERPPGEERHPVGEFPGHREVVGHHQGGRARAPVSYTHLRAHETVLDLVCRLLLEKNK